jgi:hypothetical protein
MIAINKRKISICILLSIVTCGIYRIYWDYLLIKNIRAIQKDETSCIGEMLCLVLVPFYSLFWWFTRGKIVNDIFGEYGCIAIGNEIEYLILGILGLSIVSMAIMQNDFNSFESESARSIQHDAPKKIKVGKLVSRKEASVFPSRTVSFKERFKFHYKKRRKKTETCGIHLSNISEVIFSYNHQLMCSFAPFKDLADLDPVFQSFFNAGFTASSFSIEEDHDHSYSGDPSYEISEYRDFIRLRIGGIESYSTCLLHDGKPVFITGTDNRMIFSVSRYRSYHNETVDDCSKALVCFIKDSAQLEWSAAIIDQHSGDS